MSIESQTEQSNSTRVALRPATVKLLRDRFGEVSLPEAIHVLAENFEKFCGDPVQCGHVETWVKLDRLEESLMLLAATNVEISDGYRGLVGASVARLQQSALEIAEN